jgi:NAD(P)-dependent dehydrogenase (short-subunit alcohol dehydrogenase family)
MSITPVPIAPIPIRGSAALITGGANGLGRATATRIVELGGRVCIADRDVDRGIAVARELGGTFVATDVSDPAQCDAAVEHCVDELGAIDIAFLNAGVALWRRDIVAITDEEYRRITGANIDGVFFGMRATMRAMRPQGRGAIVATSSLAGLIALDSDPAYTLTKHAVVGLVRSVAGNARRDGISVNAICPGMADTDIVTEKAKALMAEAGFPLIHPTQVADAVVAAIVGGETGRCWVCQAGREPIAYEFRNVPGPRAEGATGRVPPGIGADQE